MKTEKCGVYTITCTPTGVLYVGSSVRIYTRWSQHRHKLRRHRHTAPYFQNAWKKYGEEAFNFAIVEECAVPVLREREQYWIDTLQPAFNFAPRAAGGGMWGRHHTDEARQKIAVANRVAKKAAWARERNQNSLDALQRGTEKRWANSQQKLGVCRKGHELDGWNGQMRICKTCKNAKRRAEYSQERLVVVNPPPQVEPGAGPQGFERVDRHDIAA